VSIKSQNKTPEKTKCGDLAKLMTPSMAPPRSAETSKKIKTGGKMQIRKTEMLNTLFNHYHALRELWIKYSVGRKNWWSRVLALNKPS